MCLQRSRLENLWHVQEHKFAPTTTCLSRDLETIKHNLIAGQPAFVNIAKTQQLLYKEIERLMKKFKTHRCALDFDNRFVTSGLIDLTGE
jgi:hypothetical protein